MGSARVRFVSLIGRCDSAWSSLLSLAGLMVLATASLAALISGTPDVDISAIVLLTAIGGAIGCGLAALHRHPCRYLGLVPVGLTGMTLALAWALMSSGPRWPGLLLGIAAGLAVVPVARCYWRALSARAGGIGAAVLGAALVALLVAGVLAAPVVPLGWLTLLTLAMTLLSWKLLARAFVESAIALTMRVMYRLRTHGPGVMNFPAKGPVLVISNHTALLDPFWLGTILPRPLTPLMTSTYYDLPVVRWFMANIFGTIRVPAERYSQEVPDLDEAVRALDRGGCVLIFPEGYVRRRADQEMRRFGRGVWYILRERPETQVVSFWIEGGWGSYTSYYGGPPLTNKKPDFGQPIRIGVSAPLVLDPALLADHRTTRTYLMRAVSEARQHLGLAPLAVGEEIESHEVQV